MRFALHGHNRDLSLSRLPRPSRRVTDQDHVASTRLTGVQRMIYPSLPHKERRLKREIHFRFLFRREPTSLRFSGPRLGKWRLHRKAEFPPCPVSSITHISFSSKFEGGFGHEISLLPARATSYDFSVLVLLLPSQRLDRITGHPFRANQWNAVPGVRRFCRSSATG